MSKPKFNIGIADFAFGGWEGSDGVPTRTNTTPSLPSISLNKQSSRIEKEPVKPELSIGSFQFPFGEQIGKKASEKGVLPQYRRKSTGTNQQTCRLTKQQTRARVLQRRLAEFKANPLAEKARLEDAKLGRNSSFNSPFGSSTRVSSSIFKAKYSSLMGASHHRTSSRSSAVSFYPSTLVTIGDDGFYNARSRRRTRNGSLSARYNRDTDRLNKQTTQETYITGHLTSRRGKEDRSKQNKDNATSLADSTMYSMKQDIQSLLSSLEDQRISTMGIPKHHASELFSDSMPTSPPSARPPGPIHSEHVQSKHPRKVKSLPSGSTARSRATRAMHNNNNKKKSKNSNSTANIDVVDTTTHGVLLEAMKFKSDAVYLSSKLEAILNDNFNDDGERVEAWVDNDEEEPDSDDAAINRTIEDNNNKDPKNTRRRRKRPRLSLDFLNINGHEKASLSLDLLLLALNRLHDDEHPQLGVSTHSAFRSIVNQLKDLIFSSTHKRMLHPRSMTVKQVQQRLRRQAERQRIEHIMEERKRKREGRKQDSNYAQNSSSAENKSASLIALQSDETGNGPPPPPPSSSSSSNDRSGFDFRSNLVYLPEPEFMVAQRLAKEITDMRESLIELAKEYHVHESAYQQTQAQIDFLKEWESKKVLQSTLYERSAQRMAREMQQCQDQLTDTEAAIESLMEENHIYQQRYLAQGMVIGGATYLDQSQWDEKAKSYIDKLQTAQRQLEETNIANSDMQKACQTVLHERDDLLTQIEIMERAVKLISSEITRLKESDHIVTKGKDMVELEAKAKGFQAKLADAKSGYGVRKQIADQQASEDNRADWKKQLFEGDLRGWGLADYVPPYVRFEGYVRDAAWSIREVGMRVKEIWSLKNIANQQTAGSDSIETLENFLVEYLDRRFHDAEKDRVVFILNFLSSLHKHAVVFPSFQLFLDILFKQLDEAHFYDVMMMLSELKQRVYRWDASLFQVVKTSPQVTTEQQGKAEHEKKKKENNKTVKMIRPANMSEEKYNFINSLLSPPDESGVKKKKKQKQKEEKDEKENNCILSYVERTGGETEVRKGLTLRSKLVAGLKQFFPVKTDDRMQELIAIADRDALVDDEEYGQVYKTKDLLADDEEDGQYSNFLNAVYSQYLIEIKEFLGDIRTALYKQVGLYPAPPAPEPKLKTFKEDYLSARHLKQKQPRRRQRQRRDKRRVRTILTAIQIEKTLCQIDPYKSRPEVRELVVRGSQDPHVGPQTMVDIEFFLSNLTKGPIVRHHHWCR